MFLYFSKYIQIFGDTVKPIILSNVLILILVEYYVCLFYGFYRFYTNVEKFGVSTIFFMDAPIDAVFSSVIWKFNQWKLDLGYGG